MSAAVIDGKAFAAGLRARVREQARAFEVAAGRKAGLAGSRPVGDHAESSGRQPNGIFQGPAVA